MVRVLEQEVITAWAEANDHEVIGWATDLGVSRSVDPLKAPARGTWLNEPVRLDSWDILAGGSWTGSPPARST